MFAQNEFTRPVTNVFVGRIKRLLTFKQRFDIVAFSSFLHFLPFFIFFTDVGIFVLKNMKNHLKQCRLCDYVVQPALSLDIWEVV